MAPLSRQRSRIFAILLLAVLLIVLAAWLIGGRIFRDRVADAIDKKMGATLETSAVFYRPPLGLLLYHPRITLPGPEGKPIEIFSADRVVLSLAKIPRRHEPLLIRFLWLRKPVVHLVRTPKGLLFRTEQAAANEIRSEARELKEGEKKNRRPSDIFRLDAFSMSDARLVYEDRTQSHPSEQTLLSGLSAAIHPAGGSRSAYACRLWGAAPTRLKTSAAIDIDHRTADIEELRWEVELGEATSLSISRKTGALASGRIGGNLRVEARGKIGLDARLRKDFEGSFALTHGSAHLPAWNLDLDKAAFQVRVQANTGSDVSSGDKSLASMTIQSAGVVSAGLAMKLTGGTVLFGDHGRWHLDNLLGSIETEADNASTTKTADPGSGPLAAFMRRAQPRGAVDFTAVASGPLRLIRSAGDLQEFHWQLIAFPRAVAFRSSKFPLPFEHVGGGGTAELRDGVVTLKNLSGNYGADQYVLDNARLVLFDSVQHLQWGDLKKRVRFSEINGAIQFHQPGPAYPGGFGTVVAQLHPVGPFVIAGSQFTFHPRIPGATRPAPDYDFHVSTDHGALYPGSRALPLANIHGESSIEPANIQIKRFSADAFGGTVVARGQVAPIKPAAYKGTISITDVDLAKLAARLKLRESKHGKINGKGYANITIQSAAIASSTEPAATALGQLKADGEFEILKADFYPIPVLEDMIPIVRHDEAKTVGDAAGVFSIANKIITLENVAVNSPAIGLQGSGTIGFDRALDLQAVATPLGDWGDKLKQSGIPILSDIAGDIIGAVQKVVNAAQSELLYQIHITGTTDHPDVQTVPVPAITDSVALLFGKMLQPDGKPHRLLEAVQEQEKK